MGGIIWFRRRRLQAAIARAVREHEAFEAEHRLRLAEAHKGFAFADDEHRTVQLGEGRKRIRAHGEYDLDQKLDRIGWDLRRKLWFPPRNLRELIEAAL